MHLIYLIHTFHTFSWITETNVLFYNILIYCRCMIMKNKFKKVTTIFFDINRTGTGTESSWTSNDDIQSMKALALIISHWRGTLKARLGLWRREHTPVGLYWWGQSELGRAQWGGGDSHSGGGVRKKGPTMGVNVWHDPSQHGPCKVYRGHHQALDRSSWFSVFLPWILPLFIHFASVLHWISAAMLLMLSWV